jgi:hypothetical protein
MEGLVHSDTHINFAIHGEDRESEINIEGGEVEAQEIGGAPGFGIEAGNGVDWPRHGVWPEPDEEYIIDDGGAPGFGIEAGNGVDWQRHGEWPEEEYIDEYIIDDAGAPGFGIEAGNDVDWPVHLGGGPVHPGGGRMHGVWPMHPGYPGDGPMHPGYGGGPVHLGGYPGDGPVHPGYLGGGPVHPGGGPMHGVWPVNIGGGPMHPGGVPVHPGGGPMHGVWSMHLAGPVYLGPQEHGIPNLPHLFPDDSDDFEEGEIPDDFEEGEIPDFTVGINEEAVNGVPEILERVCESVEIDELAVEQGEDCAICLEALNHVEDDDNGNRTLHRLPCSHLFHSHCISKWFHRNLSCPTCLTPLRLQ